MDKSSSGPSVGEVGGTGDDSESDPLGSLYPPICDACEGCDDVCDSKRMTKHVFTRRYLYSM